MTNNMKSITKMVPYWIVLVAALILTFWAIKQFAISASTNAVMTEMSASASSYNPGGMGGYPGGYGYNTYCLTMPVYPMLSSNGMPGTVMTAEDKAALAKYEQEMKVYNEEYTKACREDMAKQEMKESSKFKMAWLGGITIYAIIAVFGMLVTAATLFLIKRGEE